MIIEVGKGGKGGGWSRRQGEGRLRSQPPPQVPETESNKAAKAEDYSPTRNCFRHGNRSAFH